MPSLANSNAGAMSSLTWGQAKSQVAEVVGGKSDPDSLAAAEAQIQAVLEDWNTRRNWQFLQVQAPDIPVVSGTSTYDLPAAFKKPYAAMLVNSPRVLSYLTRREYNLLQPSQIALASPRYYTLFNLASTGKVELLPTPGSGDILRVWYYRRMNETGADGELLDILGSYTTYVLDAARARLLALKGPVEKMTFWAQSGEAGFMKAVADDELIPDEDAGFAPRSAITMGPPHDNSFAWVDWGW